MKQKIQELINILNTSNKPLTANYLSTCLGVSDRSIRTYIKEINHNEIIILSSKEGYTLKKKISLNSKQSFNFASAEDRANYIALKLVLSEDPIDLYDLADYIYVSYSTIEKDLRTVKNIIQKYNLQILRKNKRITVIGMDADKKKFRRLMIQNSDNFNSKDILSSLCSSINLNYENIRNIVNETLRKESLVINDYAITNILTHLIYTIFRMQTKNDKSNSINLDSAVLTKENVYVIDILKKIDRNLIQYLTKKELDQLTILIKCHTASLTKNNDSQIINETNEYLDFTKKIIEKTKHYYNIDLNDPDFILYFSLHLKNIISRYFLGYRQDNPFSDKIYIQNPLIYDIAVFVSKKIEKNFSVKLNQDEITFIALHIGAIFEKKQKPSNLYHAGFISNFYYYSNIYQITKLQEYFRSDFTVEILSDLENIYTHNIDFIINATGYDLNIQIRTINISPLIDKNDIKTITNFLEVFKRTTGIVNTDSIYSFFKSELFEHNHYENNVDQLIQYMSNKLVNHKIAPPSFVNAVLEREHMTPTSFDNLVALPHAIECSTYQNCAYVIINDKPMKWGYFYVNIIILLGIEHSKRNQFKDIYSRLIEVLNSSQNVQLLLKKPTYQTLLSLLKE